MKISGCTTWMRGFCSALAVAVVMAGAIAAEVPRPRGTVVTNRPATLPRPASIPGKGTPGAAVAEPYLEVLLAEMKAWPVGQAVRERYRVVGVVRSVEAGGVLLERASAREWLAEEVVVDGGVTRRYGPGAVLKLEGGFAFVTGIQAKAGQKVMADVNVTGTRDYVLGNLRTKVRVLKPGN